MRYEPATGGASALDYLIGLLALLLYLLPLVVAGTRGHPQRKAIIALTLTGGWTVVGWIVAMTWAWMEQTPPPARHQYFR